MPLPIKKRFAFSSARNSAKEFCSEITTEQKRRDWRLAVILRVMPRIENLSALMRLRAEKELRIRKKSKRRVDATERSSSRRPRAARRYSVLRFSPPRRPPSPEYWVRERSSSLPGSLRQMRPLGKLWPRAWQRRWVLAPARKGPPGGSGPVQA